MGFIDSYKRLEKLCGEVLDDERRLSAYIDEMKNTPRGSYYVRTWDEDLKKLKHYRWIRNQIAHEPGCTEQNMCEVGDKEWLDEFYSRIMNQKDPLALYHKAINPPRSKTNSTAIQNNIKTYRAKKSKGSGEGCFIWASISFLVIAVILLCFIALSNYNL